jgi:hypothetical protein
MSEELTDAETTEAETSEEAEPAHGLKDRDNLVAFVSMMFLVFLMGVALVLLYISGKI